MEDRKYKVSRDQVYVGEVVRSSSVYRCGSEYGSYDAKPNQLDVSGWFKYRSILFVPDHFRHADDLLYNSPKYIALNVSDDDEALKVRKTISLVKGSFSLAPLLQYFNYPEELTYKDILEIRNKFFTGRFAMDNCELFGFKETMAEDVTYYDCGMTVTNPREIAKRQRIYRRRQRAGYRNFTRTDNAELPTEYFRILDERGDDPYSLDFLLTDGPYDAFKPHKEEEHVKKLKRF